MSDPIKPVQPASKVYAQAKRPIGKVCLPCGGKGWTAPKWVSGPRPAKTMCHACNGKGRIQ